MHPPDTIHAEAHLDRTGTQLNWLRAAVLGANDGVVSVSSIVAGVAAASDSAGFILTAGIAGLTPLLLEQCAFRVPLGAY